MGADLYIEKDSNEVTGYFRDSYNETNILWKLGLHYWGLEKEIPIGKIGRRLKLKQVKILRAEVEKRKPEMEKFFKEVDEKWLAEHGDIEEFAVVFPFAGLQLAYGLHCAAGVEGWIKFWREKYDLLIKFLDHAIELKSGIRWSV
jgi:hypothetical protein